MGFQRGLWFVRSIAHGADRRDGGLTAWTSSVTDGGDLSAGASAALVGSNGLLVNIDDANAIYVLDQTPSGELRYRLRLYIDPSALPMAANDYFTFAAAYDSSLKVIEFNLRYYGGSYQVQTAVYNDGQVYRGGAWKPITAAAHYIEVDWQAASAAGANDGYLTTWVDGAQAASLTGLDNDTRRVETFRMGVINGIDAGTRGSLYLDAFESRRLTYIGP